MSGFVFLCKRLCLLLFHDWILPLDWILLPWTIRLTWVWSSVLIPSSDSGVPEPWSQTLVSVADLWYLLDPPFVCGDILALLVPTPALWDPYLLLTVGLAQVVCFFRFLLLLFFFFFKLPDFPVYPRRPLSSALYLGLYNSYLTYPVDYLTTVLGSCFNLEGLEGLMETFSPNCSVVCKVGFFFFFFFLKKKSIGALYSK